MDMKEVSERLARLEAWVNGGFRVSRSVSFRPFIAEGALLCILLGRARGATQKRHLVVQEYQIREADKALTTMEARGVQHKVFEQGRLAYYYDAGREVPVGCFGYHRVTKTEALAEWPAFMHAAHPSEVTTPLCTNSAIYPAHMLCVRFVICGYLAHQCDLICNMEVAERYERAAQIEHMEKLGNTTAIRAFLETSPDLGVGLEIDTEHACVLGRINWAYEVLGIQGDPIWEFLKAKAVQVVQWEEKVYANPLLFTCLAAASCGPCAPPEVFTFLTCNM